MQRRAFLHGMLATAPAALWACGCRPAFAAQPARPRVMTVNGWIDASALGLTLVHEHALANFQSYKEWSEHPTQYDPDEVVRVVLPRLRRLRGLGCRTFVDATAASLGRDPRLLRRLSRLSGLNVLTVTGNYAVGENSHLPPWVFTDTDNGLARRWIAEWEHGIDGSNVRPGFIKLGFNGGPLSPVEQKLIRAAAITHRRTGLTIGAHTGPAVAAFQQLDVLEKAGVHPSAWIWIHAQNEKDNARHIEAARRGAWIEFDGIDPESLKAHLDFVTRMADQGLLDKVLISQDAGWYEVGKPHGGSAGRSYETLFTEFWPALRARGFGAKEFDTLLIRNPAKAFAVNLRTI